MALLALHAHEIEKGIVRETLGCIFKYQVDLQVFEGEGIDDVLANIGLAEEARIMGTG